MRRNWRINELNHSPISSCHHLPPVLRMQGKEPNFMTDQEIGFGLDYQMSPIIVAHHFVFVCFETRFQLSWIHHSLIKITPVTEISFVGMFKVFLPEHLCPFTFPEDVTVIWELRSTPSTVRFKKRVIIEVRPEKDNFRLKSIGGNVPLELVPLNPLVNVLLLLRQRIPPLSQFWVSHKEHVLVNAIHIRGFPSGTWRN